MFGRKPKLKHTIVIIAFQFGYMTVTLANEADEHLDRLGKGDSALECMVTCGYLTKEQARHVQNEMEANHPESYILELARKKRVSIKKMDTGLRRRDLRFAENA